MTITLGGVDISDNMYLDGVSSSPLTSSTKVRTIEGVFFLMIKPNFGGRELSLGTLSKSGSTMGIWCQYTIDDILLLESAAQPVVLDYRGTEYTVSITGKSEFVPFLQTEPEGPNKAFTGQFFLTEV